jgi:Tfp pilus assembly protein PilF
LSLNRHEEAYATFAALAEAQPTAAALNNVGVAHLRRAAAGQESAAVYYFTRAVELDPGDADYYFNLGYAYWLGRDPSAAVHWLREAVRRNPADGDAHFVVAAALAADGTPAEAARERELARRLSSRYEQWEKRSARDGVPRGLERIKNGIELPHARPVEAALAVTGQRDQRELARFHLDRGRRLFAQDNDREAMAELDRVLYLSPYEPEAHLLAGRIHLRSNRLQAAIDSFKISLWSSETAAGHIALAEAYLQSDETAAARSEVERAAELDPGSVDVRRLLDRIAAR